MKFIVVLALVAVALAEPEADPAYYYTNAGLQYVQHAVAPSVYNFPYTVVAAKADGDKPEGEVPEVAEEEEKKKEDTDNKGKVILPYTYNTVPLAYNTVPLAYNTLPVAQVAPVTYTVPKYYAQSAPGVVHVAKREAEADPAYYYNTPYAYSALPYAYNTLPYAYRTPVVASTYAINPVVAAPVIAKASPSYYAQSAPGVVHQVAKREAEADAAYYYNALPYASYGYRFPSAYNYGYGYAPRYFF